MSTSSQSESESRSDEEDEDAFEDDEASLSVALESSESLESISAESSESLESISAGGSCGSPANGIASMSGATRRNRARSRRSRLLRAGCACECIVPSPRNRGRSGLPKLPSSRGKPKFLENRSPPRSVACGTTASCQLRSLLKKNSVTSSITSRVPARDAIHIASATMVHPPSASADQTHSKLLFFVCCASHGGLCALCPFFSGVSLAESKA